MDWAGSAARTCGAIGPTAASPLPIRRSRKSGPWSAPARRSKSDHKRRHEMAYWLMKTEPEEFSWDDQVKRGAKGESWTGVRNFTARRHLKEMKKGDLAFFY